MQHVTVRKVRKSDGMHVKLYAFPIPDVGDKGFYRLTLTLNSFFYSSPRRNHSPDGYQYSLDRDDGRAPTAYERKRDSEIVTVHCAGLLDFLRTIDYSREEKRFVCNPHTLQSKPTYDTRR